MKGDWFNFVEEYLDLIGFHISDDIRLRTFRLITSM